MNYTPGTLVKTRGREWVVLPESSNKLLILRPLGDTDEEVAGVYLPSETVEPTHLGFPIPARLGPAAIVTSTMKPFEYFFGVYVNRHSTNTIGRLV